MNYGIYYKIYFSMGARKLPVDNFYKKRSISALSFDFVGFLRLFLGQF